ncbi:hypothetical protein [Lysinibacillus xylanilyticus]|uniref:hypothetical protein n=1 Tax=Lysinibacillus xylanilyticus TaxID=582475 RepID=UPI003CFD5AEA
MARSKHPVEIKLQAIQALEEGNLTIQEICQTYSMFNDILHSLETEFNVGFNVNDIEGLKESTSKELKMSANDQGFHVLVVVSFWGYVKM